MPRRAVPPDRDLLSALPPLHVLCEDGPVLAVNKPAGLLTQGVPRGIPTLEAQVKAWLAEKYDKPGNVYLGIPHRLDRPVSGVVVFARNSKGAARLAEQFRDRQVRKIYRAIVERPPDPSEGELCDWLLKRPESAHVEVVPPGTIGAREARLSYRTLAHVAAGTLIEIDLKTGRMHQIRVQLASRGWPILGDVLYGARQLPPRCHRKASTATPLNEATIALHAWSLTILHPVRYDPLTITAPYPAPWNELGVP